MLRTGMSAVRALLAMLALGIVAPGEAGEPNDPVGVWKFRSVCPDGKRRECLVTVFREHTALRGTYAAQGATRPAKDVVFDRGVLSVRVDGDFAGQAYELTYKGRPQADTLSGTVRWTYRWVSGSFAFDGERIAAAPVAVR
jgi:hypothetical protein